MKGKVIFHDPEQAIEVLDGLTDGVPASEAITQMVVGRCKGCGARPEDTEGGVLMNARLVNGVLRGDTFCVDCAPEEEKPEGFFDD